MAALIDIRPLRDATDVDRWRLCVGCGACTYACPQQRLHMVDRLNDGLRPVLAAGDCGSCTACLEVCPGLGIAHPPVPAAAGAIPELADSWGPVLEVWEGHAGQATLRHDASSGGLASALALFAIEQAGMLGLLHIVGDPRGGVGNLTRFSRSRAEIEAATGSRYAPASPCDQLQAIEDAGGPCVFIGKPCDVQGLRKAQALRPALDAGVGLAIGIFCAGTPSTQGTIDLLRQHRVPPDEVAALRYRGRGWPGSFAVQLRGNTGWHDLATYAEAWGFLQAYRPHRCHLCPDGSSEFADLSCGDPWYRTPQAGEPGSSLLLVRTERGRQLVRQALAAGYVDLRPLAPGLMRASQRELQYKRGAIWARLLTLRSLGVPAPRLQGFALGRNWLRIPWRHQLRSFVSTLKRVWTRGLRQPLRPRVD